MKFIHQRESAVAGAHHTAKGLGTRKPVSRLFFPVVIFLSSLALFMSRGLIGVHTFDEGFVVTGAMQVLHGKLPYRDFLSLYGPGQYYLTAGLFTLFGEQLAVAHIAHAVILAGLAVTVFELAAAAAKGDRTIPTVTVLVYAGIALYAWPNVGYSAISAALALLLGTLVFGRWVVNQRGWILGLSSVLVGIASIFRWDFGVFGLVALAITMMGLVLSRPTTSRHWVAMALWAAGPALGIITAVYVPLLAIFSDPTRWYQEVVRYSIVEFPKWRNLEYVRPWYWAFASSLRDGDGGRFSTSAVRLLYVGLPFSMALATLGVACLDFVRRRPRLPDRASAQSLLLSLITLLLLNQMRVRPSLFQGFAAVVASLPLFPYLLGKLQATSRFTGAMRTGGLAGGLIVGSFIFQAGFNNWFDAIASRPIALNAARAAGIRVGPDLAYYAELVNYIQSMTRVNEAIYSGAIDHSRLFVNDSLLYFLANRLPADRFTELEPGISNTRAGQREIMKSLEEKAVRIVVLLAIESKEPNLTSVSNGVHDLDEFLAEHYCPSRYFGPYTVLEAK
jgi:hypothetical protein